MRTNTLLLVGLSLLTSPLAAQTVYFPSAKQKADASGHEKAVRTAAKEAVIVDNMKATNDVGADGSYNVVAFDNRARSIQGSPFLVPTWSQGEVLIGTSTKASVAVLKFDVYTQQVQIWRAAENDSVIIDPNRVQGFTLRPTGEQGQLITRHFERLPSALIPSTPIAYAEDLSKSDGLRLLKFSGKKIVKLSQGNAGYGSSASINVFQDVNQYFLRWSDGTYVSVKPNRSSILAATSLRHADKVAMEIQDKSKLRSDAELGALVARLDSAIKAPH